MIRITAAENTFILRHRRRDVRRRIQWILCAVLFGLSIQACKDQGNPVTVPVSDPTIDVPAGQRSFARDVQPIFVKNCALAGCHAPPSPAGNFNITTYAGVRAGGYSFGSSVITPGDSANSAIIALVRSNNNLLGLRMPLSGTYSVSGLPDSLIVRIGTWIMQGALDN